MLKQYWEENLNFFLVCFVVVYFDVCCCRFVCLTIPVKEMNRMNFQTVSNEVEKLWNDHIWRKGIIIKQKNSDVSMFVAPQETYHVLRFYMTTQPNTYEMYTRDTRELLPSFLYSFICMQQHFDRRNRRLRICKQKFSFLFSEVQKYSICLARLWKNLWFPFVQCKFHIAQITSLVMGHVYIHLICTTKLS